MKIIDGVHLLESSRGSHVYLVGGSEKVLVDTGMPFLKRVIRNELGSLARPLRSIRHIVLTHHDVDHVGSAALLQRLTGAELWASVEDIPYILGQKPRPGFKRYAAKVFHYERPWSIRPLEKDIPGADIDVIPSPGHTPGHVCFLYHGVLFAGDLVESRKGRLIPYPPAWDWDPERLAQSIRDVSLWDFDWVCPAHGRPVKREGAWDALLEAG